MTQPLVSVICLCHNHAKYITSCIESVLGQTYKPIEIIIVDDASTDGSKEIIADLIDTHPEIKSIDITNNVGNCKAFNKGLAIAKGEYIVDLATDDLFYSERIEKQIALFQRLPKDYGVVHTNAIFLNDQDLVIRDHKNYLQSKGMLDQMPEGDVYEMIISKFFVSGPTMLVKRQVFDDLGGYDELLTYEDFDFWVRSARKWKYAYLDETLTKIRKVAGSKSGNWYAQGDKQLYSTYLVCRKISEMNQTEAENQALIKRFKYELRQSLFTNNYKEFMLFYKMLGEYKSVGLLQRIMHLAAQTKIPLSSIRSIYHRLRYTA
ncbi:MAG: glycosyltransferase [Fulvivirga sp.]